MPYYSDLGLTGIPSSSAYSSLFLPGPYSNHSSIIASNFSHTKPLPRQYRGGYKPHLSTISELRRINSPKLLYHSSPKIHIQPIKKINTADIDVSLNRFKKYERHEKPKSDNIEKKTPEQTPSPKRSPRTSLEDKEPREAKPNTNIRRERATVRLHTVHKDTLQNEIGAIRSWRDNFKPEELDGRLEDSGTAAKKMKKTPGEILKEKFLIRSRSKENMLKPESKKLSRKKSVRKSPSFHDICEAITSTPIDEELNPGQPEAVQRRQSRQMPSEKMIKEIRRSSTTLSEDDIQILDAILAEQNKLTEVPQKEDNFESRGSVRKKRITKKKSSDGLTLDEATSRSPNRISRSQSREKVNESEIKSPLERRPTKKRSRRPFNDHVDKKEEIGEDLAEQIYKNVIRDISQVEIEQTAFKPKPVITGSGDIEETKPSLKAFVNDIEVKESPVPKKEKKFRFNVIVEVQDEEISEETKSTRKTPKITAEKFDLTSDNKGKVQLPKGKAPVISSILKKRPLSYSGQSMQQKEKSVKREKLVNNNALDKGYLANEVGVKNVNDMAVITESKEEKPIAVLVQATEQPVDTESDMKTESKIETKTEPKLISRLQRGISTSSSSKESSPVPTSPTIKEKNLFNKILSKKENTSQSDLFNRTDSTRQNSTSSNTSSRSSEEKFKSPPLTPVSKVQENSKKFCSPPSSLHKKINIFSRGATPPLSPVIKKESVFNRQLSKTDDAAIVNNVVNEEVTNAEKVSKNEFNRNISKTELTSDINNSNELVDKKETPPASPAVRDLNLINSKQSAALYNEIPSNMIHKEAHKEETPPVSPTVKTQNSDIIIDIKDKRLVPVKDENDNTICSTKQGELEKSESQKSVIEKKLVSKRSLVQKANKDDPDLEIFVAPEPEPEPEPEEEKKDVFVPLQSNRLSQWMHPWKKPEHFDVCPVEIFARPKDIRGRHYPRPRGHPAAAAPKPEEDSSSSEEEDDTEDETSSEEEESTSEEESEEENAENNKIGASTSSNDSGFGSGALGSNEDCDVNIHKKCEKLTANLCGVNQKLVVEAIESVKKGSLESRDSPTSNHANNPAFALDSGDVPEEYSQSSTFTGFQKSGRITPPATTIPRFRKYCLDDFNFLKVLGKGSFGKVLLAELKGTEYYYAIKCLKKDVVLEDDDVECTLIERKVLALGTKHPYLCHLLCTFQTESHLFFVMEYLNGGDLMFHIQASGRFPEHQARFYGAEIVSGLKFLHNKGIVYRDLKLDNVLLDFDGHVRIADFGMCKLQIFLDRMAETFCGTPDYMAPEIIKGQHYNQCVDWWSFGVLLYEMLLGQSPFSGCDEDELFWSICNEKPVLPRYLSSEATNILTLFLEKDASKRLGNRFSPHGDIQDQPFFKSIDWYALETRQLEAPFKPTLQHPLDTQYFDKHFTVEKAKLTPIDTTILQSMDQTQFQGFSYTNPNATDK